MNEYHSYPVSSDSPHEIEIDNSRRASVRQLIGKIRTFLCLKEYSVVELRQIYFDNRQFLRYGLTCIYFFALKLARCL